MVKTPFTVIPVWLIRLVAAPVGTLVLSHFFPLSITLLRLFDNFGRGISRVIVPLLIGGRQAHLTLANFLIICHFFRVSV
jgi:hypothetical protein